jgi:hypothetical protein
MIGADSRTPNAGLTLSTYGHYAFPVGFLSCCSMIHAVSITSKATLTQHCVGLLERDIRGRVHTAWIIIERIGKLNNAGVVLLSTSTIYHTHADHGYLSRKLLAVSDQ